MKSQGNIHSTWTKDCKVFIKRSADHEPELISNIPQLSDPAVNSLGISPQPCLHWSPGQGYYTSLLVYWPLQRHHWQLSVTTKLYPLYSSLQPCQCNLPSSMQSDNLHSSQPIYPCSVNQPLSSIETFLSFNQNDIIKATAAADIHKKNEMQQLNIDTNPFSS